MRAQINIFDEIIVDNFAGGGGASTGIELAAGRPVTIAVNHDPDAILMHETNHPYTQHFCESVWDIDPREVCAGRPVGLAWFSPDCKHFSKAKGGKPVSKNIRGLAWVVLRWAALVRPRVIMLENVAEFQTWGPVRRGRPIKSKSGVTFQRWKSQLESLGYAVDMRELRACDYGAATIRKRFFMIARCDSRPIVWPEPTHGAPDSPEVKSGKLIPWRTAAEIIDWSLPCPSIFDTSEAILQKYGIRAVRPLADNTMHRIARGIRKFVIDNPQPFIVQCKFDNAPQSITNPIGTITSVNSHFVCEPYIVQCNHSGEGFRGQDMAEPLQTVTGKHGYGVVMPVTRSIPWTVTNTTNSTGESIDFPIGTARTGGGGGQMLITPALIQYHTEQSGREVRGQTVDVPVCTVDASNRYALVSAFLSKYYDGGYRGAGSALTAPVHTITAQDHNALAAAHLIKLKGDNIGQPADEPVQTVTAGGNHFGEVVAFLMKYYGTGEGQLLGEPTHTQSSKDHLALVTVQGVDYAIVDIGLRMLTPKELFLANGFPEDYIIDRDHEGNEYGKSKQVARCGNAVPPPFATALVRANLPELCGGNALESMAELTKQIAI